MAAPDVLYTQCPFFMLLLLTNVSDPKQKEEPLLPDINQ